MKRRKARLVAGLMVACGCGGMSEPRRDDGAPAKAGPSPLSRAAALARADRALSKVIAGRRPFTAGRSGFETSFDSPPDAAFVRFEPNRGFSLSLSRRNRPIARLDAPQALTLDGGVLTEPGGGARRSVWLQSGDTLEQLLLNDSGAAVELEWRLALEPPVVSARRERSGAILLTDADDRGILRVPVPYAIDAAGAKLVGHVDFELRREAKLALRLNFSVPASANPPLLIDPALAVVAWQERSTKTEPLARVQTAVAYHPGLHAVVLHGGNNEDVTGADVLGDTWAYDGEWSQLQPASGGPARYGHGLAFTNAPASLLLFGGRDENRQLSGSTFRWIDGTWSEVATTGPSKRDELGMVHAPGLPGGDVVLFGGSTNTWQDDTWLWNGTAWAEEQNAGGPGGFGQSLVFDTARDRALVFGGARSAAIHLSSLALFDGARWIDTPDPAAPTRAYAAMAFDSDRARAVLFGGEDSEANFKDETWEWDSKSARWSERLTDVAPPPLAYASMAYDPERKRAVLVGGWTTSFEPSARTWEYRALGGSCETDAECDGVACVDGACCKQAECGTCEVCSTVSGECEKVVGEPDPDSCSDGRTCDRDGACKLATAVKCRSDQECESGACADGVCCDRVCDGACEACDREGAIGTCSYVVGSARHGSCDGEPGCGGECSGDSPRCILAEAGTTCGSACERSRLTLSSCDGEGACVAGPSADCPRGLGCDGDGTCLDSCRQDDDCRPGLSCREGACVAPARRCRDRSTLQKLDGSEQSCAPYACVSGECLEQCDSAAQCALGFVCDENAVCISPPTASAPRSEGCGCRAAGHSPRASAAGALLALLAATRGWRRFQKRALAPKRGTSANITPPVSSASAR